ncbi:glycogen debranching enzyme-like protein [Sarcoptes scabiei]|uniref:Glycogen debranching enzyme n=1 Tax=Sarcoptes scabiei TaxID=52283 RepID=A0A132A5T5_SARSC|nr:glycogen debranching enzyme-like protein [Sarcoptes scabiei]
MFDDPGSVLHNLHDTHCNKNDPSIIWIFPLGLNQFNENKLFRCDKNDLVRFTIDPSLYGRKVCLLTNYSDDPIHFDRSKFHLIDIEDSENILQFRASGNFEFIYFEDTEYGRKLGHFYIVVSPQIKITANGDEKNAKYLTINAIQTQTILSKLMGPIETWKDKLEVTVSIQTGYNMIHWTPIQKLGGSNSAYSLADQHSLNPTFDNESNKTCTMEDIQSFIEWLKNQGVISITDIVLNHTANETTWLREHPEASYNCHNSPWLRPAYLLDRMLWNVSLDIENGLWKERGIGSDLQDSHQLNLIQGLIHEEYLPRIKLEEFFLCDLDKLIKQFEEFLRDRLEKYRKEMPVRLSESNSIDLIQDPEYHRFGCQIDFENAFKILLAKVNFVENTHTEEWIQTALSCLKEDLHNLNAQKSHFIKSMIDYAIENVMKGARYERFDESGPKIQKISYKNPLATKYFTDEKLDDYQSNNDYKQIEQNLFDPKISCQYMAHNGWVMNDDPLKNFAEKESSVYLRRELICWGDSVKLRYGNCHDDSPFLWSYMEQYVTQMAKIFQGLRLDNCHSTPIHVAQHMIDSARRVNPDLYLIAELFTSSEDVDNIFVNKLGINSLIRETMSADRSFELGRQVFRYGGQPVGSFKPECSRSSHGNNQMILMPMIPSMTHAIFFDQTHDNESLIVRRTVYDTIPNAALIAMIYAATGSNRGYDELVPHHINVVHETRTYRSWNENDLNLTNGIIAAKRKLNQLHYFLNSQGYTQSFVDQRDRDTIVVTHSLKKIEYYVEQLNERQSDVTKIINGLDLIDLNYILFRCNQEEFDENQLGVYALSNGSFVYCGLASLMFHLSRIRSHNDLGHPLCNNLREGDWLPNYILNRLEKRIETKELASWLRQSFEQLSNLPRYMIPCYFNHILSPLYCSLLSRVWICHSNFISSSNEFVRRLALGGIALIGFNPNAPLPPLATELIKKFSNTKFDRLPTMAAGLPHFSSGYMRNWGRDTFISLKGLTLLTGRFEVAQAIILGFAGCLRHGLIPNLLDGGRNARYNCRDAVWWWLQAIKEYILLVPDGHTILDAKVNRIFPTDDSIVAFNSDSNQFVIEPLHKTIQEALQRHFSGINFIERNAGTQIDEQMTMEGFKIDIKVDRDTGFVKGGNQWNCGTWMDKMGSSEKAGNKGKPATPRDGSAVEIVGLSYSVINFLADLYEKEFYPYKGLEIIDSNGTVIESWTFRQWSEKIKENFEKYFYIEKNNTEQYVNKFMIYKDTVGASLPWMDFQLRPNFLIAMTVSPDLFHLEHALEALQIVKNNLVGPLGIKTLDPSDWNYRGDYDNSNDTTDANIANGFNYHNGPEWLWLMGYYLMAKLLFTKSRDHLQEIAKEIDSILSKHFVHLCQNEWFGLPELTNSDGKPCWHSCPIQSWSHATILEAIAMKENLIAKQSESSQ